MFSTFQGFVYDQKAAFAAGSTKLGVLTLNPKICKLMAH